MYREPFGAPIYKKNKMSKELTQARLKELLHYDPETGVFTWRVDPPLGRSRVGKRAGCLHVSSGYWVIRSGQKNYRAARLATLYVTGSWPEVIVDHRNGVRSDDRWENIRPATFSENSQNSANRSGCKGPRGTHWHAHSGLWRARITRDYVEHNLGYFPTPEAAHQAYLNAKREMHTFSPIPRSDHATC